MALHTTWYSHHKGHPGWFGEVTPPAVFERFLQYAWQATHLQVTIVLSGYLGSAAQADLLARYLPEDVCYVCDPVMGDTPGGQYVSDEIVQAYRERLIPRATVLLPNQFELGLLAGSTIQTTLGAIEAAHGLLARYPALHTRPTYVQPRAPGQWSDQPWWDAPATCRPFWDTKGRIDRQLIQR